MGTRHHNAWCRTLLVLAAVLISSCTLTMRAPQDASTTEVSEMESSIHHSIDYIEFAVTDMAESKRFFEAALEWTFNDYGPDYAGIQGEGREMGGFRVDTEVTTGGPLVVLYSNDLNGTLAKVREAGGRIVREPFDFPGGRRFHFHDPSGNELAVWSEK